MKIVHLSTTDLGGAYKAVERIHKGMLQIGVDSIILLRSKYHEESTGQQVINNPVSSLISKTKNVFNILRSSGDIISDYYGTDMSSHPDVQIADAILVHWCNSFISYDGIRKLKSLGKPIYVVAHDMWSYTGGCHYDDYCEGYKDGCVDCLRLPHNKKDIARGNYLEKVDCYKNVSLICPSNWSVDTAKCSDMWKDNNVYRIYNPLDYGVFHPISDISKEELLKKYSIVNKDKKIILYGANLALRNTTKGGNTISDILQGLDRDKVQLVVYGNGDNDRIDNCPIDVTYLGYIRDEKSMAEVYNLADVYLAPSKQESFCYTVCEALACGTPVVAYRVGGIAEQVIHKNNGYLAEYGRLEELSDGLKYCLCESESVIQSMDMRIGLAVLDNGLKNIANQYIKVINDAK